LFGVVFVKPLLDARQAQFPDFLFSDCCFLLPPALIVFFCQLCNPELCQVYLCLILPVLSILFIAMSTAAGPTPKTPPIVLIAWGAEFKYGSYCAQLIACAFFVAYTHAV